MEILHNNKALANYLNNIPANKSIGFVPTMGALHQGHLSLLEAAAKKDDIIICSIFVNPTQFNQKKDFDTYPSVLEADIELLKKVKVDMLFAPSVEQIYPDGNLKIPHYDIGMLDNILEGEHRPGHFQGVCHIIDVFLRLLNPNHIYMGEKDIQQVAIVKHLIELKNHKTKVVPCPTLREESGLAMSSRNRLLSKEGKKNAAIFHESLSFIRENAFTKSFKDLKKEADERMIKVGFTPEYIALCNANSLEEIIDFEKDIPMRLIAAAFIEGVRLIDNIAV